MGACFGVVFATSGPYGTLLYLCTSLLTKAERSTKRYQVDDAAYLSKGWFCIVASFYYYYSKPVGCNEDGVTSTSLRSWDIRLHRAIIYDYCDLRLVDGITKYCKSSPATETAGVGRTRAPQARVDCQHLSCCSGMTPQDIMTVLDSHDIHIYQYSPTDSIRTEFEPRDSSKRSTIQRYSPSPALRTICGIRSTRTLIITPQAASREPRWADTLARIIGEIGGTFWSL